MAEEETKTEASDDAEPSETEQTDAEQAGEGAEAAEPQNRRARRSAAAQARKARVRERQEAEAVGLDTQEMFDDALARSTDTAGKWLRNNSSTLQWIIVAGIAGWSGWGIYNWQTQEARAEATAALAVAVDTERGKIGDPTEQGKPNDQNIVDPTPIFADEAALRAAALERFSSAAGLREGSGTSAYARLGRAAILYDEAKFDEALAIFDEVANGELAKSDPELRGRSVEGIALAQEGKGDKDAALKAYQRLENTDTAGFEELALYQQARLQRDLGKLDAAKELAKKLNEKLGATSASDPMGFSASYVERGAKALSEELGLETAAPPSPGGSQPITPEQIKALQQQVQEQINSAAQKSKNEAPAPEAPAPEAPAPEAPAPEAPAPGQK